jgi:ATPase subunit of ABC transporter with duplicated ATPase domains
MQSFKGNILFTCRDYEILNTVANRIIEILPDGSFIDRSGTYEEYLDYKRSLNA